MNLLYLSLVIYTILIGVIFVQEIITLNLAVGGIRYPGDATCDGLGTSTAADYAATVLNSTTVFVLVKISPANSVAILAGNRSSNFIFFRNDIFINWNFLDTW